MGRKRACDVCYKKKIQCDGDGTQCDWCSHHDLACTYNRPSKKRTSTAAGYKSDQSVAKRIERLELMLNAVKQLDDVHRDGSEQRSSREDSVEEAFSRQARISYPKDSPGAVHHTPLYSGESTSTSHVFNLGRFYLAGHHIGGINSANCLPSFSDDGYGWICSRTGEEPSFASLRQQEDLWKAQAQADAPVATVSPESGPILPDRAFLKLLATTFCESRAYMVFPVIDIVLFQETIELVYRPDPGCSKAKLEVARASVFAFLALTSIMTDFLGMELAHDTQVYTDMATQSMSYLFGEPGVTQCETLVTLAISGALSGYEVRGSMMHSLSCRALLLLDAHTASPRVVPGSTIDDDRARFHLRRLFWATFTIDKEMSLRSGSAPALPDEFLNLSLPAAPQPGADGQSPIPEPNGIPGYLVQNLGLSLIKSKISRQLYSESASRKTEIEILHDVRQLDDELETWRLSLPAQWRPRLDYPENYLEFAEGQTFQGPIDTHNAIAMMGYYHLLGAIHRASGRCRAWPGMESSELEGISSSLAISVQASRLTLLCLRATYTIITEYSFCVFVFYPLSAVLAIFCNVLIDPLNSQVMNDLDQIEAVPGFLRHIRKHPKTPRDHAFLSMVEELCKELARLGRCAVIKALQDHDTISLLQYTGTGSETSPAMSSISG